MQAHPKQAPVRDERGASMSVFFAMLVPVFLMLTGLVVDGAAQSAAHRRVEVLAAQASRAGADAASSPRLSGRAGATSALQAARQVLADQPEITSQVWVADDGIHVEVSTSVETTFLQIIGIDELRADGSARAELDG